MASGPRGSSASRSRPECGTVLIVWRGITLRRSVNCCRCCCSRMVELSNYALDRAGHGPRGRAGDCLPLLVGPALQVQKHKWRSKSESNFSPPRCEEHPPQRSRVVFLADRGYNTQRKRLSRARNAVEVRRASSGVTSEFAGPGRGPLPRGSTQSRWLPRIRQVSSRTQPPWPNPN